jgi:4-hydroxy-2-oxoheptanedioate aldolase
VRSEVSDFGGVRRLVRGGGVALGITVTAPDRRVVGTLARSGFDFAVIDLEHSLIDPSEVSSMVMATAGSGCSPMARLPGSGSDLERSMLDGGMDGLWIPQVEAAAEVDHVIARSLYPPSGLRGVGPRDALERWGQDRPSYLAAANDAVLLVVLIESPEGIAALPEILERDRVDAVAVATGDLAARLGHLNDESADPVVTAVDRAERLILESGKALAGFAASAGQVEVLIGRGCRLVTLGTDLSLLGRAGAEAVEHWRGRALR